MGVDILFVGLIFVGLILAVKVVTEGMRQLNDAGVKLDRFKLTTEQCLIKTKEETEKMKQLETTVRELEQEYQTLADKEHSLEAQVNELQQQMPQKPKARIG